MNLSEQLARVVARDARFSIEAYSFVLESYRLARSRMLRERRKRGERPGAARKPRKRAAGPPAGNQPEHVSGRALCLAARSLALRYYGSMAITVLECWGIRSTSDIGDLVYHLIASGEMEKTDQDQRSDFDDVFNFARGLRTRTFLEQEPPA